ncbi:MAG: DsbA family oxidoreductase [Candidatus Binataceae bacterium]
MAKTIGERTMNVNIDIISDVVCPWCFIGKRRLETALAELDGGHRAHLRWRPFELNPDLPREGMDRKSYLDAKFGGAERARDIYARITAAGAGEGIEFHYEHIARTPNTFSAHRLLWMAERHGIQNALAEALFKAYFVDGVDIGDPKALEIIAVANEIDAEEAARFLAGEEGVAQVRAEERLAHELGVSGVPFFILNGRYGISGAQDSNMMRSAIARVIEAKEEPNPIFAAVL